MQARRRNEFSVDRLFVWLHRSDGPRSRPPPRRTRRCCRWVDVRGNRRVRRSGNVILVAITKVVADASGRSDGGVRSEPARCCGLAIRRRASLDFRASVW